MRDALKTAIPTTTRLQKLKTLNPPRQLMPKFKSNRALSTKAAAKNSKNIIPPLTAEKK